MKPVLKANIFALIVVVGQVLGGILLVPIFKAMNLTLPTLMILTQLIFLIVPAIIYFIVTKESIKDTLKLNPIGFEQILILVVIVLLSWPVAGFLGGVSNIFFENLVGEAFELLDGLSLPFMIFVMAVMPAICEEIAMRGIVLSGYSKKSTLKAALMSGFIFGIIHLNPQQFLYAFALGILFAYIVRITNSIYATMFCHFMFNGTQVILSKLVLDIPGVKEASEALEASSKLEMFKALIPLGIIAIISIILIVFLLKLLKKTTDSKISLNINQKGHFYQNSNESSMGNFGQGFNVNYGALELSNETMINIPFIIMVIFYCVYVYIQYF
ncbi:CPBP family intramembrane glutamic endopeptidase [Clostridium algidicarnis]|uniref:CPBP family intramembrane metalloprotease n=1 Tax=Clostridium algidicarnis TaxID=37659 RepID=A0ABS6C6E4_9CLOT|nr:type II CAAX endopeptidase family protein [Clostridium algidicarnis]MBB6632458.1 CPBP family intramembrane metalloprotease [Clostridium algidicarnis]MBU3221071.1 CPBP family intramembrane metalloprotease [Clostridium algidicarnis]